MASSDQELHRRIRDRAYRIWQDEGKPEGRAAEHWRLAQSAIATEDSRPSSLVCPAARSESVEETTKQTDRPKTGHGGKPELGSSREKDGDKWSPDTFRRSVPPGRVRPSNAGRMNTYALRLVFATLAGVLVYRIGKWAMRRRL